MSELWAYACVLVSWERVYFWREERTMGLMSGWGTASNVSYCSL